ncbi:VanZ family protein [Sulfitobacter sp. 1A13496]|uniref:VanZ family protein n=1 Tax=Sulfitobacter sp. 1A13496 TaxID=3368596 RepID=UPI003745EF7B
MVSIAILTLIPINVPTNAPGTDKTHHLLAFAALSLPCAALYPKALLRVALAAAVFGASIEVIQPYVGRQGEVADLIADVLGIGVGATLGLLLHCGCRTRTASRAIGS